VAAALDFLEKQPGSVRLGQVQRHGVHLHAMSLAQLPGHFPEPIATAGDQDQRMPIGGKAAREFMAQAIGGAGDEHGAGQG